MKRVVKDKNVYTVSLENVNACKIYAFKGCNKIYKAHRIGDDKFAFVSLANSDYFANGVHNSLEKLIGHTLWGDDEVFEFDDLEEFVEWLNDEV